MTNNNTNLDPDFNFPSSPSSSVPNPIPFHHHQKPRKKRTKLINIEPNLVPSSSAISTDHIVSKPKQHTKKPDPSAPKITKPCTECGKKFWSWKALFGHMRCHPERQWRGINPPPNYRKPISPIQEEEAAMSAEDHEVAASLLLLSNGVMETGDGAAICSSFPQGEEDLNYGCTGFECSSCKKVFGSHQALGGHRASHKNVKGCFAITRTSIINGDQEIVDADGDHVKEKDNDNKTLMVLGHKCSICLRVFSSGQALGGHKRCHWEKGEDTSNSSTNNIHQGLNGSFVLDGKQNCGLDLNLPATVVEDESCSPYSPGFNLDLRLGI